MFCSYDIVLGAYIMNTPQNMIIPSHTCGTFCP